MRKKITAANWKMNMLKDEVDSFLGDIKGKIKVDEERHKVIIAPPYVYLNQLVNAFEGDSAVAIYAQNMHFEDNGAYTGEISDRILKSIGVNGVIIGHSERRKIFDESLFLIQRKLERAGNSGMYAILCCGEPKKIRKQGQQKDYILEQLENASEKISAEQMSRIIIAYEPIWAIGTGDTATPEQAQEIHAIIRDFLSDRYSPEIAENTSILYGGSVKPDNALELFSMEDIDGGLVGSASLDSRSFLELVNINESV